MRKIVLLASLFALSAVSTASMAADGGAFIRGEIGQSDVTAELEGLGSGSDEDTSFAVRGGYFFNANFGVEAFWGSFYEESTPEGSIDLTAVGAGLVARHHFGADGHGFFIDGRAGIARGEADVSVTGLGSGSESSTKPYFGVGAGYDFGNNFAATLGYTRLQGGGDGLDIDVDVISAGLELRF